MSRTFTHWTPEMDACLREIYPARGAKAAAARLGVTAKAVENRAGKFGLRKERERAPVPVAGKRSAWTPAQDEVLRARYLAIGPTKCAALLPGRTPHACHARASALGLVKREQAWRWSEKEDAILRDRFRAFGAEECAQLLPGRTPYACAQRASAIQAGVGPVYDARALAAALGMDARAPRSSEVNPSRVHTLA